MTDAADSTPLPLRALALLLNRAIAGDPVAQTRLRALDGRCVHVRLDPPGLGLALHWQSGQLLLSADEGQRSADLTLQATPGTLLGLLLRALSGQAPQAQGMQVSGDAELARVLAETARHYRPDPGGWLRPLFGEVAGQSLVEGLSGAARFARRSLQRLAASGSDYLRDESAVLITVEEQAELIDDIEQLRDDVERAEARLKRLRASRGKPA